MAYKIRYGIQRGRQNSVARTIRLQVLGAAVLLVLTGLAAIHTETAAWSDSVYRNDPTSLTEQAVMVFASALAAGKGWYYGFLVWCRAIFDGAAV